MDRVLETHNLLSEMKSWEGRKSPQIYNQQLTDESETAAY